MLKFLYNYIFISILYMPVGCHVANCVLCHFFFERR